jgi:hypothetical protein
VKDSGKLYWYGVDGQVLAESDTSGNITSEFSLQGGASLGEIPVPEICFISLAIGLEIPEC